MPTTNRIPNAQKWTVERVREALSNLKHEAVSADVDYLGIALIRQGLYIQIWAYWKKTFANYDDIMEDMLLIDSIFEARLFQAALRKQVSPWVAIFGLKNNHHWCEKQEPQEELSRPSPLIIELDEETIDVVGSGGEYGTYKLVPKKKHDQSIENK